MRPQNAARNRASQPATVIMPTIGRTLSIARALDSIFNNLEACEIELIVVQNGSNQKSSLDMVRLPSTRSNRVKYIYESVPGLLSGRHRGFRDSTADNFLIYVDDDIEVSETWLASICEAFEDPEVAMVGGPCVPEYESEPPEWIDAFWRQHPGGGRSCGFLSLLDFGNNVCEIDPTFIWGLNFAIRKSVLEEVGGFHPDGVPWEMRRYRGDGESAVSIAVKNRGYKSVYHPGAAVKHLVPSSRLTLDYFKKRSYLQGISSSYTQLRQKYRHDDSPMPRFSTVSRVLAAPRRIAGRVKRTLSSRSTPLSPEQEIVRQAYREGFQYHQSEFKKDETLQEWVLRDNYWDYTYPNPKAISD